MCPDLFEQMRDALQVAGLSDKTQAAYLRSVRLLCDHHHTPPQSICEAQLRTYFLFRRNVSRWTASTLRALAAGHTSFPAQSPPPPRKPIRRTVGMAAQQGQAPPSAQQAAAQQGPGSPTRTGAPVSPTSSSPTRTSPTRTGAPVVRQPNKDRRPRPHL
jgi:hypothetical protein